MNISKTNSPRDMLLLVPQTNTDAYRLLFLLEAGLREFLIKQLDTVCGPQWWKERIPKDVLEKCKMSLPHQRSVPWITLVPHHPIYYVDFPDLSKILQRKDNWRDAFRVTFGNRQEVFIGALSSVEPIRNAIAHNRVLAEAEFHTLQGVVSLFRNAIGEQTFAELLAYTSKATDIPSRLQELKNESLSVKESMQNVQPLALNHWPQIATAWWFDEEYLGRSIDGIKCFFGLAEEYSLLPRHRGTGHMIETWLDQSSWTANLGAATDDLNMLLSVTSGEN